MHTTYPTYLIPKEIECIEYHQVVPINKMKEESGRVESNRRNRQNGTQRKHHLHSPTEAFNMFARMQNRKRESLRSISSLACIEAQKFLETKYVEILLEYSSGDNCDVRRQPGQNDNEPSLSALAGLLSATLADAVERGYFSFEDSSKLCGSKKMHHDVNHQFRLLV